MLTAIISDQIFSNKVRFFYAFAALSLALFTVGAFVDVWIITSIPFAILAGHYAIRNPKNVYLFLFAILPFSIEIYFSNGLGTDLPTEPIILFLFFYSFLFFFTKTYSNISFDLINFFLFTHVIWIAFSSIFAVYPLVSLKFFVAKLWYVLPFFFLFPQLFNNEKQIGKWIKIFLIAFAISVVYVMTRHITRGFSFDTIGWAVSPFYRNHVNYAVLLTISLPLCWYKSRHSSFKKSYYILLFIFLAAIYFSFTRAAMVAVLVMFAAAILIKLRLLFIFSIIATLFSFFTMGFFLDDNKYLDYAPRYETTVAHTKFDKLMEATYKMEDISTMERLHRWVAGMNMIKERPLVGFGPNNFYFNYKPYANYSFKTYVSDNPDKSGIHNYYLMIMVEQGIIGFLIFVGLLLSAIYTGENAYHRCSIHKDVLFMCLLILIGILVFILINDLLEVVKVGSFFFIVIGLISRLNKNVDTSTSVTKDLL